MPATRAARPAANIGARLAKIAARTGGVRLDEQFAGRGWSPRNEKQARRAGVASLPLQRETSGLSAGAVSWTTPGT